MRMNRSVKLLLYFMLCNELTSAAANGTNLLALSSGAYVRQLYGKLKNEAAPSETDSTASHAANRLSLCQCLFGSGFFKLLQFNWIDPKFILEHRHDPSCAHLFRDMFIANSRDIHHYSNEYRLLRVARDGDLSYHISEQVFICPLQDSKTGEIFSFYVSKEYNVGRSGGPYKPGRFLFVPPRYKIILAEEPVRATLQVDTGVELHFLRIRKYVQPVQSIDIDPLCRLISHEIKDPNNQHYRICVAVYRSSYFRDEVDYRRHSPYPCRRREIAFRTPEAVQLSQTADGQSSFYENMTLCFTTYLGVRRDGVIGSFIYISRAYKSDQVFVYRRNPADQKIYLENLSVNIGIVDEQNSFDFIED